MPAPDGPFRSDAGLLAWHEPVWRRLQLQRTADRLPHALLLHGARGLGKERFAAFLAQALVCESPLEGGEPCGGCRGCRLAQLGNHPDIRWVRPEEEGRPIRVDAVREACAQAVLAADGNHHRVFLFAPADRMNAAAANALLKTLEEPVERTVILLISSSPQYLPATVRSRCQQLLFRTPARETALAWLNDRDEAADTGALGEALALAGGAPLEALERMAQGLPARLRTLQDELFALAEGRADPIEVAGRWQDLPIARILETLQLWLIDLIRLKTGDDPPICYFESGRDRLQSLAGRIDFQRLFGLSDLVGGAKRDAANNLNPHLLTERLLIDWCQTIRSGRS